MQIRQIVTSTIQYKIVIVLLEYNCNRIKRNVNKQCITQKEHAKIRLRRTYMYITKRYFTEPSVRRSSYLLATCRDSNILFVCP